MGYYENLYIRNATAQNLTLANSSGSQLLLTDRAGSTLVLSAASGVTVRAGSGNNLNIGADGSDFWQLETNGRLVPVNNGRFQIPKYTTIANIVAIADPEEGDLAYAQDTNGSYVYDGSNWLPIMNPYYVTAQINPGSVAYNAGFASAGFLVTADLTAAPVDALTTYGLVNDWTELKFTKGGLGLSNSGIITVPQSGTYVVSLTLGFFLRVASGGGADVEQTYDSSLPSRQGIVAFIEENGGPSTTRQKIGDISMSEVFYHGDGASIADSQVFQLQASARVTLQTGTDYFIGALNGVHFGNTITGTTAILVPANTGVQIEEVF